MTNDTITIIKDKPVSVNIDKEYDTEFRKCTSLRSPDHRGRRKDCANEAIDMWNEWVKAIGNPTAMKAWCEKWSTKVKV